MSKENTTRKIYQKWGIILLITALLLSWLYRPFIYQNNINDFGFADVIGNLFSVITACFFFWGFTEKPLTNKNKNTTIILGVFIYGFLWEFLGVIHVWGTADIKDIIAAIISGVITILIKNRIELIADRKKCAKRS